MFDVGWQVWLGLILVGIVVYFVLDAPSNPNSLGQNIVRLWLRLLDRLAVPEGAMPADEARAERTERLKSMYPGLTDDTVAAFLLAQANALTATSYRWNQAARSEGAGPDRLGGRRRGVALVLRIEERCDGSAGGTIRIRADAAIVSRSR